MILIESQWNLKVVLTNNTFTKNAILIESQWNLKWLQTLREI